MLQVPSWALDAPGEAHILPGRRRPVNVPLAAHSEFWRVVGDEVWTCNTPPFYSYDKAALRELQQLDPSLRAVWRKQAWLPPGEMAQYVVAVHFGIARRVVTARSGWRPFKIEPLTGSAEKPPNFVEFIFSGNRVNGGPAEYQPFDMEAALFMLSQFTGNQRPEEVEEDWYQSRLRERERADRERARRADPMGQILGHASRTVLGDLSAADEKEIADYLAVQRARRRGKVGTVAPMVLLGRS